MSDPLKCSKCETYLQSDGVCPQDLDTRFPNGPMDISQSHVSDAGFEAALSRLEYNGPDGKRHANLVRRYVEQLIREHDLSKRTAMSALAEIQKYKTTLEFIRDHDLGADIAVSEAHGTLETRPTDPTPKEATNGERSKG